MSRGTRLQLGGVRARLTSLPKGGRMASKGRKRRLINKRTAHHLMVPNKKTLEASPKAKTTKGAVGFVTNKLPGPGRPTVVISQGDKSANKPTGTRKANQK